jgi:3-oxoacyl-[acyl-carrier-protein] synthase III
MKREAVKIGYLGMGCYLPVTVLSNRDLEGIVDTSDDWIQRRSGIRERRVLAAGETILDMTVAAARRALDDAGVDGHQIGDVRVGVNTWLRFPSLATQVQRAIGAREASAADVSAGCAGFIYAVEEAYNKILIEKLRYGRDLLALVVGVDGLSHITDWTDRSTCVLLGDGAGAVVLGAGAAGSIEAIHTHADGRHGDLLYSDFVLAGQTRPGDGVAFTHQSEGPRPYLHMDGPKVYPVAVKTMVQDVRTVLGKFNRVNGHPIGLADVRYVYPHQANLRIIETVAKKLGVPLERVYTDGIARYGNTSTASIPIGYCETRDQEHAPGGYEIDVAFGAGFASGALLRRVG